MIHKWYMKKIPEIDINNLLPLEKQAKIYFVVCSEISLWNLARRPKSLATPLINHWLLRFVLSFFIFTFSCGLCVKQFSKRNLFYHHWMVEHESSHKETALVFCNDCYIFFPSKQVSISSTLNAQIFCTNFVSAAFL